MLKKELWKMDWYDLCERDWTTTNKSYDQALLSFEHQDLGTILGA